MGEHDPRRSSHPSSSDGKPGRVLRKSPGPTLDTRKLAGRRFQSIRDLVLDRTFHVTTGLHSDREDREAHLLAISEVVKDDHVWALHSWLHQNLSILDDKANSILAVNSIGLAILTFLYSAFDVNTPAVMYVGSLACALIFLWAIVSLSRISFVYWTTTADFLQQTQMLQELLLVRDKRTAIVRSALIKDAAALVIFGVTVAVGALDGWVL